MANKYKNSTQLRLLISLGGEPVTGSLPEKKYRAALIRVFESNTQYHPVRKLLRPLGGTFADNRVFREGSILRTLEEAYLNHNVGPLNALCDVFHANTLIHLVPLLETAADRDHAGLLIRMIKAKNRMLRFALLDEVYAHYLSDLGYPLSVTDRTYDESEQSHRVTVQSRTILFHQAMITNVTYRPVRAPLMADLGLLAPHKT